MSMPQDPESLFFVFFCPVTNFVMSKLTFVPPQPLSIVDL